MSHGVKFCKIMVVILLGLISPLQLFPHSTPTKHKHTTEAITDQPEYFPARITHLTTRDGLPSNQTMAVSEDPDGQIWILTPNGICVYNGHRINNEETKTDALRNLKWMLFDNKGRLWSANSKDILRYDGQKVKEIAIPKELKPYSVIASDIGLLGDTSVILFHAGLIVLGDTLVYINDFNKGAPDITSKIIFPNRMKRHYVISDTLGHHNFYTSDWEFCRSMDFSADPADAGRFISFLNSITPGGFQYLKANLSKAYFPLMNLDEETCRFNTILDMPGHIPVPKHPDAPDLVTIYETGERIASCYLKSGDHYIAFWDGVPNSMRNMFISSTGDMYFTSDKGIYILHPEEALRKMILGNSTPPPPKLVVRKIAGNSLPFHEREKARISWEEQSITLDVCLVDMTGELPITQYRLNNGQWTDFSCEKPLQLDHLSHGNNTIELRVLKSDKRVSVSSATVYASVNLPLLDREETRTLIWAGGILLLLLVIWTIYQRLQMRRELKELRQSLYRTQLNTIQSQLNPHFLFNAMLSLQNTIKNRSKEEASKQLEKLSKIIKEVMDLSQKGESKTAFGEVFIPLEKELQLLRDYVELENQQREPQFDFQFHVDPSLDTSQLKVPPLMIQPFVENAIIHGIPDVEDGIISVQVKPEKDWISYIIKDNGIGIEAGSENKRRRFKEFKSHGGAILRQRMDLLRSLGYPVELHVNDAKPKGTIVKIKIPKKL